jgi:MobA/MobL family
MAIMFLSVTSVSRGRGGSAVAKAAYVARERLHDARTGTTRDYRRVPGLEHAEIMLPAGGAAGGAEWARDRATLWNSAESAERNRNARVAREYTVALPHELTREARLGLAREFAQNVADRYGTAVDLAVHGPTARGDPRNHHAHILATTRELTADGLGRKATIELGTRERRALGLQHIAHEFRALRAQWAELANKRLREAHVEARLEPRSRATLARQREAGRVAAAPESVAVAASPAPVITPDGQAPAPRPEHRDLSIDAAQQRAAAQWLAYRAGRAADATPPAERDRPRERSRDAALEL